MQEFPFDYAEENSALSRLDPATTWVDGDDFLRNNFDTGSPKGTATGPLVPVDLIVPFPANSKHQRVRGGATSPGSRRAASRWCSAERADSPLKALNAQAAGASAVIVMNEGQPGRVPQRRTDR